MKIEKSFYATKDHSDFFWQTWKPDGEFTTIILIIHGLGEHIARYDTLASQLLTKNYLVSGFDHRGHGQTKGKRGAASYKKMLADIDEFVSIHQKLYADKKIILFGHSMGGNLVINYLLKYQPKITAAIASAPALQPAYKVPAWKTLIGKSLRPWLPDLTMKAGFRPKDRTRSSVVLNQAEHDPLLHGKISIDLGLSVIEQGIWAIKNASMLSIPLLLQHGMADGLTSPQASEIFAENAPQDLITLNLYEGLYHELHHEPEAHEVIEKMMFWIQEVSY